MEGLISAQLNPIRTHSTQESSVFFPTFSLRIKTIGFGNKFVAMKNLKSMLQFSHWRPQKRASSTKHCYQKVISRSEKNFISCM